MTFHPMQGKTLLALAAALALAACASTPPPKEQLAVANSAVDQAASNAADAPAELAAARDKLTRANAAMAAKDYVAARQLADRLRTGGQALENLASRGIAQCVELGIERVGRARCSYVSHHLQ